MGSTEGKTDFFFFKYTKVFDNKNDNNSMDNTKQNICSQCVNLTPKCIFLTMTLTFKFCAKIVLMLQGITFDSPLTDVDFKELRTDER